MPSSSDTVTKENPPLQFRNYFSSDSGVGDFCDIIVKKDNIIAFRLAENLLRNVFHFPLCAQSRVSIVHSITV